MTALRRSEGGIHDPAEFESLSKIWELLHTQSEFQILAEERHYLTTMAVSADDDIVSHLLLRKLRMAKVTQTAPLAVTMGSFVEFSIDGDLRFSQVAHPSPHMPVYASSIVSLEGAGLIGLQASQTILWPSPGGPLVELHVKHVENSLGVTSWVNRNFAR